MDRFLASFLGAIVGCVGGLWIAPHVGASRAIAEPGAADEATLRDLKEQLAEVRRLLERPAGLAPSGTRAGEAAGGGTAATPAVPGATDAPGAGQPAWTPEALEALVLKAAETALDRRDAREKAIREVPEKKRLPLREVARELSLSAAQEGEVRQAYIDAGEKFLKVMAEPESDAETLRRELEASKGDTAKRSAIAMKHLPKLLTKFGDMMAIQAERDAKIRTAVGAETAKKMKAYKIEEEDPFDLEGSFTFGED